jgi:hypothetical protein
MNGKLITYFPLTRKVLHVSLVLLFSLSFISTGAQAQFVCDEMSCNRSDTMGSHSMGMSLTKTTPPMGCCSGAQGSQCTFETSKKLSFLDYAAAPYRSDRTDLMHTIGIDVDILSPIQAIISWGSRIQFPAKTRSKPTYIQTLSLRC